MTRYPPWGTVGTAAIARWALATQAGAVRIEGLEHIPSTGPVMLVARHFHHLLDGAVLVRHVPRPVHIVVGLDWTEDAKQRAWMERACRAVQWPIVLRAATLGERGGYDRSELARYTRSGVRDAVALLRAGRVVVVFPEGYPNVDPAFARLLLEGFNERAYRGIAGNLARQGAAHAIADDVEMRVSVIAKTILIICPLAAGVGSRRKRQRQCG